jgi:hypothetical protein
MPRIRCHYLDCIFLDEGYCSAAAVEIDPDTGCATYSPSEDAVVDEDWEEEELEEWEDDSAEEEDDIWSDEDDDI